MLHVHLIKLYASKLASVNDMPIPRLTSLQPPILAASCMQQEPSSMYQYMPSGS